MKKIITLLFIATITNSFGQWINGDIAKDFTLSDKFGNLHNLYSQLNSGKPVLLDFSFPACRYCYDDCVEGTLSNNNAAYGIEGSNQIRTYLVDVLGGALSIPNLNGFDTTNQNLSRGDFANYANYPLLNQGSDYGDSMKIVGCPTYILVCPDKRAYQINDAMIVSEAQNRCGCSLSKTLNKVRIYTPELTTCSGFNRINVYGHLINTGSNNITSARVKLMVNNTLLKSKNLTFTGTNTTQSTMDLIEFNFDSVLINQPLGHYGKGPYKIIVDMINGVNLTTPFEKILKITKIAKSTMALSLGVELKTDAFASQTEWVIYNSKGNIVNQNQSLTNNVTTNTPILLQNNECYTIRIKDSKGNGINTNGFLKVKTPTNIELCNLKYGNYNYENFGYDAFSSFAVGNLPTLIFTNNINELSKLVIYPNPVLDKFRIETSVKVTLNIIDLSGKVVKEFKAIDNSNLLDITELASGCYIAKINSESDTHYFKLIKK